MLIRSALLHQSMPELDFAVEKSRSCKSCTLYLHPLAFFPGCESVKHILLLHFHYAHYQFYLCYFTAWQFLLVRLSISFVRQEWLFWDKRLQRECKNRLAELIGGQKPCLCCGLYSVFFCRKLYMWCFCVINKKL